MGELMGEVLKSPTEWCRIEGVEILDPDGWRGVNGRPWNDPITLAEFRQRLVVCTQRSVAPAPLASVCKCPGFLCSCHHDDTQPAGEHHVGTLDLSGEGNRAEVVSPISDEATDAMAQRLHAFAYPGAPWDLLSDQSRDWCRRHARAALEAAYPAIRQQVAEEIAQRIEARRGQIAKGRPGWVYLGEAAQITREHVGIEDPNDRPEIERS